MTHHAMYAAAMLLAWPSRTGANDCFNANFNEDATGSTGHFGLDISATSVTYSWDFDITGLSSPCGAAEGLDVHVHSTWDGFEGASSATQCSGAGGHYDPTLACSPASSMSAECVALSRTAPQGYSYACNPTDFAAGLQYLCEVGDIAGKLGTLFPSGDDAMAYAGELVDPFPPSAINFGNGSNSGIATSWESIVLHCPSSGDRLLCAAFKRVTCSGSSSGSSSSDDLSSGEIAGIVLGSSFVMAFLVVFVFVCWSGQGRCTGDGKADGKADAQAMLAMPQRS